MTDEERLHMITEQLIIVRDNLFRGMSKSIQKLQAKSINEVLGLDNFIQSPKPIWVGLTDEDIAQGAKQSWVDKQAFESAVWWAEEKLKEKNRG